MMFFKKGISEQERFSTFLREFVPCKLPFDTLGKGEGEWNSCEFYAGKILQEGYNKFSNNVALIYQDKEITYKELYFRACEFARQLIARGVRPEDRVLLFFRNSLEFYIAYFAAWQVGAIIAPLNIFLKEHELAHIIQDCQAKLAIVDEQKKHMFAGFGIDLLTQEAMDLESPVSQELPEFEVPNRNAEEVAALLYTSGTTGLPKGVMLSSKNIITNVAQVVSRMPFSESKKIYCVLPLFHCFAQNTCVWTALLTGCTVILVPKISRKEIVSGLQHRPDIFLGVPALYGLLCLLKTAPLTTVEYFICGGDALPDKIRAGFALVYGRKLCNGYGLTETSPLLSVDLDDLAQPTNTVGTPVVGVECAIKDEGGNNVSHGEIGNLWVKGDNIMMGYYHAPEKTKEVLKDGWLATGDLAKFDECGKLLICGRLKDLIIYKGMNIYPQEIENVILKHNLVLTAGVIGKDHQGYGQVPIAFVKVRENQKGIEAVLRTLCEKELAAYKIPREFIILKDMPLTATGKVDKNSLRKQYLHG